jgi:hypothetical protein
MIIRFFINYGKRSTSLSDLHKTEKKDNVPSKKISKGIGEYIDYEEIKK